MRRYRLNPLPATPTVDNRVLEGLYGAQPGPQGPQNSLVPTSPGDVLDAEDEAERNTILLARLLRAEAVPKQRDRFGMVD